MRRTTSADYYYLPCAAEKLRRGDEMKAVDGQSWRPGIRHTRTVVHPAGGADQVLIWDASDPGVAPADRVLKAGATVRIRRPVVPPQ